MMGCIQKTALLFLGWYFIKDSSLFAAPSLGAYAVAKHRECGYSDIPNTTIEIDKLMKAKNFSKIFQKNFYWQNTQVKSTEWLKDSDYIKNSKSGNGFDGADASSVTYLASHGETSNGIYRALAGSSKYGGCFIPSNQILLGNQNVRFLFLSTCQGLKIGSGYDPTTPGENPSKTWGNSVDGVHCIFGYSNNMADADGYGKNFLDILRTRPVAFSKAFLDASDAVSTDNIPAVMCFGSSSQDALNYLQSNKTFDVKARPHGASAWIYRQTMDRMPVSFEGLKIPANIRAGALNINVANLSKKFLGNGVQSSAVGALKTFKSKSGVIFQQADQNIITIENYLGASLPSKAAFTPESAIDQARQILKSSGIDLITKDSLKVYTVTDEVSGDQGGVGRVLARKVIFKQIFDGVPSLGQLGSVEVTVDSNHSVRELRMQLIKPMKVLKQVRRVVSINQNLDEQRDKALTQIASEMKGAKFKVIKQRMGYFFEESDSIQKQGSLMAEFLIEATQGTVQRNFIRRVLL